MRLAFIVIISFVVGSSIFSQGTSPVSTASKKAKINELPLYEQFDYAISKSSSYEEFQVVRRSWLYQIKSNTKDTIIVLQSKIDSAISEVIVLNANIKKLSKEKENAEKDLSLAQEQRDSLSFLGMLITKGNYKTMMWLIVFVLLATNGILYFLFRKSKEVTDHTKKTLQEKEEEFSAHRKWSLEREQKLARELHREKQKNISL